MHKMWAVLALSIGLAACSGAPSTETEAAPETEARSPEAAQSVMQPGLYAVGDGNQIYSRTRLNEDGTYTDYDDAMRPVGGGSWAVRDALMCFDPEGDGEDQQERCWTVSGPDANGVIMSARVDSDERYVITPIEE
ncbi:MAG: hypothetical protein AAFQ15_04045 [Pseudomonadota bacterium]